MNSYMKLIDVKYILLFILCKYSMLLIIFSIKT